MIFELKFNSYVADKNDKALFPNITQEQRTLTVGGISHISKIPKLVGSAIENDPYLYNPHTHLVSMKRIDNKVKDKDKDYKGYIKYKDWGDYWTDFKDPFKYEIFLNDNQRTFIKLAEDDVLDKLNKNYPEAPKLDHPGLSNFLSWDEKFLSITTPGDDRIFNIRKRKYADAVYKFYHFITDEMIDILNVLNLPHYDFQAYNQLRSVYNIFKINNEFPPSFFNTVTNVHNKSRQAFKKWAKKHMLMDFDFDFDFEQKHDIDLILDINENLSYFVEESIAGKHDQIEILQIVLGFTDLLSFQK